MEAWNFNTHTKNIFGTGVSMKMALEMAWCVCRADRDNSVNEPGIFQLSRMLVHHPYKRLSTIFMEALIEGKKKIFR